MRAATALARLWQTQGKAGVAHDLLTPIHGRFPDGLDCAVVHEAAALLAELAADD